MKKRRFSEAQNQFPCRRPYLVRLPGFGGHRGLWLNLGQGPNHHEHGNEYFAYAEPIRALFCCPHTPPPTAKKFDLSTVLPPIYKQVYAREKSDDSYQVYNQPDNFRPDGFAPIRILINPTPNLVGAAAAR